MADIFLIRYFGIVFKGIYLFPILLELLIWFDLQVRNRHKTREFHYHYEYCKVFLARLETFLELI